MDVYVNLYYVILYYVIKSETTAFSDFLYLSIHKCCHIIFVVDSRKCSFYHLDYSLTLKRQYPFFSKL